MIQVLLLKDYNEHQAGDTISVSNNVAFGLYEKGIAKKPEIKDSLVKTELGETKGFKSAPSKASFPKKAKADVEDEVKEDED